jgi:hypothetical protein
LDDEMNKLHELKSPVTGKPISWTSSASTDIRATFERIRAEQTKPAQKKNVQPIRVK